MKIGIISDTHDRIERTKTAIGEIEEKGCKKLIHCGDFCSPFMIEVLAKFSGEVYCCFGNTDDRFNASKQAVVHHVDLQGDIGKIDADGKTLAFTHMPRVAEGLAATGNYDAVFHGHTHSRRDEMVGETLLANPGEIMGHKGKPSYAVYDTETGEISFFELFG